MVLHARRSAGFTLLELLIAVTILGLLMVLVVSGVQFGTRVWETGRASAARIGEAETARTFLRGWIEASLPVSIDTGDGTRRQIVLGGGPERMHLPALMPAHLGGGLHLLELSVVPDGTSRDLVLRSVSAEAGARTEMVTVLVADVEDVRFAYFGADGEGSLSWQSAWQEQDVAPLLVRVAISFPEGDRRRWLPVIAAPMVDGAE